MTETQQRFALVTALALLLLIVELVRRRRLSPAFAWGWLVVGVGIMGLVIWYDGLLYLTHLIGAVAPTSTLFLFGILFLLLACLQFSMRITSLEERLKVLAQELALLRARHDEPE